MANNYNAPEALGSSWLSFPRAVVENSVADGLSATFSEHINYRLPAGVSTVPVGQLAQSLMVPSTVIDLIDPKTGATIGATTLGAAWTAIYSVYRHAAKVRDSKL